MILTAWHQSCKYATIFLTVEVNLQCLSVPESALKQRTYNVTGFSFTPEEIAAEIRKVIPHFEIDYNICPIRQAIGKRKGCGTNIRVFTADSWPRSLDDVNAKKDWGWYAEYGLEETCQVEKTVVTYDRQIPFR